MIGLPGAMFAYLVLFGPMVLFPQLLDSEGIGSAAVGLLLAPLPVGYALPSLTVDRLLPSGFGDRLRVTTGSLIVVVALFLLAWRPVEPAWIVPFLVLLGLGAIVPANNDAIMVVVPKELSGTAGALVNMVRALGTSIGTALVALGLHLSAGGGTVRGADGRLPLAILIVLAAPVVLTARSEKR